MRTTTLRHQPKWHSLYVFTVTTTSVNQAAGSPYNILERYNPSCSLIMQPR
jgi:hypothetical protein